MISTHTILYSATFCNNVALAVKTQNCRTQNHKRAERNSRTGQILQNGESCDAEYNGRIPPNRKCQHFPVFIDYLFIYLTTHTFGQDTYICLPVITDDCS